VWFATESGATRFDGGTWVNYTTEDGIGASRVLSIAVSSESVVWFGTDGGGVTHFDGENWTTFTTEDGLVGNVVRSIVIDAEGKAWFDTNEGFRALMGSVGTIMPWKRGRRSSKVRS
jgi:ligand-binding sensor domain-containing protein